MLQVFKIETGSGSNITLTSLNGLPENLNEFSQGSFWINLEDPDEGESRRVAELFSLPDDFLADPLDPAERPRAGHVGEATLVIARASYHPEGPSGTSEGNSPAAEEKAEQSYPTVPIGMVFTPSAVITTCRIPGLVPGLLGKKIPRGQGRPTVCLGLKLLEKISSRFINHLEKLDEISGRIEEAMQKSTRNEDLRRILQLQKTLVYFLNASKANALVLDKLLSNPAFVWNDEEREWLVDALIECRQAVEMAEVFTQIITNMSEIYASMISNNMNMVVKFLTAITLILMAPSIIVGLYGMNVPLPLQESPLALPAIVVGTVGICWALWRYLQKKHWM